MIDITRRLRKVEKDIALARFSAIPLSAAQRTFERLCRDLAAAGLDFRAYPARVSAIRQQLYGHPAAGPAAPPGSG